MTIINCLENSLYHSGHIHGHRNPTDSINVEVRTSILQSWKFSLELLFCLSLSMMKKNKGPAHLLTGLVKFNFLMFFFYNYKAIL